MLKISNACKVHNKYVKTLIRVSPTKDIPPNSKYRLYRSNNSIGIERIIKPFKKYILAFKNS